MKLQHEDGPAYRANRVTVHYDNKIDNLAVDSEGCVEVTNQLQADQLMESHGKFKVVEESDLPDYVLADKNVQQVKDYIRNMQDLDRLKELRQKESSNGSRKTALKAIDDRINQVRQEQEPESADEQDEPAPEEEVEEKNENNEDQTQSEDENEDDQVPEEDESESNEDDQ